MKYIQILIDNKYRELYAALLLKFYIEDKAKDVKVALSNKVNLKTVYEALHPEIVVLPRARGFLNQHVDYMKKKSRIVVMTSGGSNINPLWVKKRYLQDANPANIKALFRIYLWGIANKEELLKYGVYNDKQLLVTGNPRFDIYKILKRNDKKNGLPSSVGFGSVLKMMTSIHKYSILRLIEIYSKFDKKDEFSILWAEGKQYADFIWYETAVLESIIAAIKRLSKLYPGENILFRPHPFESSDVYQDWVKGEKYHVIIEKNEPMWDFLRRIYVYITIFSTTAIEAMMMNIPVISLRNLLGGRLKDHIRSELYNFNLEELLWQPNSLDELTDLVERARNNKLPLSPYPDKTQEQLQDVFNYNSDKTATELIGDDLISMLNLHSYDNKDRWNLLKIFKYLFAEPYFMVSRYSKNDYNYSPIRLLDRKLTYNFKKLYSKYFKSFLSL